MIWTVCRTWFFGPAFRRTLHVLLGLAVAGALNTAAADTLELFVDSVTKQIFTEPGPNRISLGRFAKVQEAPAAVGREGLEQKPSSPAAPAGDATIAALPSPAAGAPVPDAKPKAAAKPKWYDALSVRGYTQFRYAELLDDELKDYRHHADRGWADDQSFLIRRARLILSGDLGEHLFLYLQPDFAVTPPGSSQTHFVQLRDAYADISFDKAKEFRVRAGQSKIPYGFENMQSSSNRLALDRADALNSCCKDERDIGVFLYWAPAHIRALFKEINDRGLKGSGDYGVAGFGLYNGQGANRNDANDHLHLVARLTWPWKFMNGQIFEAGVQAQTGRFVPSVDSGIALAGSDEGLQDARFGISAILYPQPFGLQAEWNWGRGPSLNRAMNMVEVSSLNGGYVQAMYRWHSPLGYVMPFVRWQQFDGAMKFERNAPFTSVDETELGVEWQVVPEVELTAMYVKTDRTNVLVAPYEQVDGDLMRFQLQWNY